MSHADLWTLSGPFYGGFDAVLGILVFGASFSCQMDGLVFDSGVLWCTEEIYSEIQDFAVCSDAALQAQVVLPCYC